MVPPSRRRDILARRIPRRVGLPSMGFCRSVRIMRPDKPKPDTRLIERWLPIAELGEESIRERRSMTALPPTYYLHVWWARRPLVASRAAVLASLLPADADREKFLHTLGIHGDPVEAKKRIAVATRKGERLGAAAYGYRRAFGYTPDNADKTWIAKNIASGATLLDPTAGGGSVPFEGIRLGARNSGKRFEPSGGVDRACDARMAQQAWNGSQDTRR